MYNALWDTDKNRKVRLDEGIGSENYRKLLSGDDTGAKTGDTTKVNEATMADLYGNELVIPVGRMLNNQGLFTPRAMNSDF